MSDELWREAKGFWTVSDAAAAMRDGWGFEPVAGVELPRRDRPGENIPMRERGYALMWLTSDAPGFGANVKITDYVAGMAAQGVALYERAWLLYCKLDLEGRIAHDDFGEDEITPFLR